MHRFTIPAWVSACDYLGEWAIDPDRAAELAGIAGGMDFTGHKAPPLKPIAARLSCDGDEGQYEEAALAVAGWMGSSEELAAVEMVSAPGGKSIALVKLTGILMKSQSSIGGTSTVQARREIRSAAADPNVAGILLAIESPGGTVAGQYELAADIQAAGRQKPVWSYIEDLGASAAYWAAAKTARIVASSPLTQTGSIGTLRVMYDTSKAAEEQGVRTIVLATGPLKGEGIPGAPITQEQVEHAQGKIDSMQESFDAAVKTGRGLSQAELNAVKHGASIMAPQALEAKLIDAIQPLGKVLSQFAESLKATPQKERAGVKIEQQSGHALLPMMPWRDLPLRS